jgi:hypothetical protein
MDAANENSASVRAEFTAKIKLLQSGQQIEIFDLPRSTSNLCVRGSSEDTASPMDTDLQPLPSNDVEKEAASNSVVTLRLLEVENESLRATINKLEAAVLGSSTSNCSAPDKTPSSAEQHSQEVRE